MTVSGAAVSARAGQVACGSTSDPVARARNHARAQNVAGGASPAANLLLAAESTAPAELASRHRLRQPQSLRNTSPSLFSVAHAASLGGRNSSGERHCVQTARARDTKERGRQLPKSASEQHAAAAHACSSLKALLSVQDGMSLCLRRACVRCCGARVPSPPSARDAQTCAHARTHTHTHAYPRADSQSLIKLRFFKPPPLNIFRKQPPP